ncbi:hypothetical protein EW026_g6456 [Hermanssonia centrifuga]|uniref:DUF6533 domain-containing protein n=1 Tax=Hermanssonia centrifuga TaxID=98765 RepID=A0A4S4KB05_9APHY|nr:hypothetical protein EW026_g6456 [Hermanssonia centrifuga]
MSSNTTAIDQEAIAGLQENVTINYIYTVLAALVAYEFLITINQEISMAWQRKPTGATWLFMINRYLMLVTGVLEVRLPWMSSHHQHGAVVDTSNSCAGVFVVSALMFSQFIVFAMFSALRIYAVWDRSLPLFVVVFALNLVPLATNLYTAIITSYENVNYPLLGTICGGSTNLSWGVFFGLVGVAALGTRLALIVADLLVVVLTWVKTWETRRLASEAGIQVPLITLLLRDGTVYFM